MYFLTLFEAFKVRILTLELASKADYCLIIVVLIHGNASFLKSLRMAT